MLVHKLIVVDVVQTINIIDVNLFEIFTALYYTDNAVDGVNVKWVKWTLTSEACHR